MSRVHNEIKGWLLTQQDWLQEAADRLLNQGQLHDQDIAAIAELLKTEKGQAVTSIGPTPRSPRRPRCQASYE